MPEDPLIAARKRAEHAVDGMVDGPLKVAAFQTILARLLATADSGQPANRSPLQVTSGPTEDPGTLTGRVLLVKAEGFFKAQRNLSEVREILRTRGWHYPLTSLSGAMQALVRQRQLRRERVSSGSKQVWKYSNP